MENYYKTLGVDTDASSEEIKSAFRKKALECHPDKVAENEKPAAHKRFITLANAYFVLSDDNKRKIYDETLSGTGRKTPRRYKISEIVEQIRRDFGDTFASFFDEKMFILLKDQEARIKAGMLHAKGTQVMIIFALLALPTFAIPSFLICLIGYKIAMLRGVFMSIIPALLFAWLALGWLYSALERLHETPFEKELRHRFKKLLK